MKRLAAVAVACVFAAAALGVLITGQHGARAGENVEVKLCDNHTTTTIAGDQPATRENGEKIAKALMDQWMRTNPDAKA